MPKLKTHQATAKRYKKTGSGKIKRRVAGQGHFNKRENGKTGRQKRRAEISGPTFNRIIQITLPN